MTYRITKGGWYMRNATSIKMKIKKYTGERVKLDPTTVVNPKCNQPSNPSAGPSTEEPNPPCDKEFKKLIEGFNKILRIGPPSPPYPYKEERAVRGKTARAKLPGRECDFCEDYYKAIQNHEGLSDEQIQDRRNKCSKHRTRHTKNKTPPHHWDVAFPSTPECIARVWLGTRTESKNKLKPNAKENN